jgi:two-component system OmpR family response regulator
MPNEENKKNFRKVLLIEDDEVISRDVAENFSADGYMVTATNDGIEGLRLARTGEYDLAIIDCGLPGIDGLSLIRSLRAENIETPALFLSALGEVSHRVAGLAAGGDDYLPKPFHMFELTARAKALLRRAVKLPETALQVGPLELSLIARSANRNGRDIQLLPREFKLLEYLMRHVGLVITRTMLLEEVWGYKFAVESNVVDVHMSKLRHKVDGPGEDKMILSIRGSGFMLRNI